MSSAKKVNDRADRRGALHKYDMYNVSNVVLKIDRKRYLHEI
jgi:hypothetical protein